MPKNTINRFAHVVLPIPVDKPFTYAIPSDITEMVQVGVQVIVPVGERLMGGIVTEITAEAPESDFEIKMIADVVDSEPFVGGDILKLLEWISGYYICHLGEAFRLINPGVNLEKTRFEVRRSSEHLNEKLTPAQQAFVETLPGDGWVSLKKIEANFSTNHLRSIAHQLKKMNIIETRYTSPKTKKIYKTVDCFQLAPEATWLEAAQKKYLENPSKRSERALALITYLKSQAEPVERPVLQKAQFTAGLIKKLTDEGVLLKTQNELARIQAQHFNELVKDVVLTDEQQEFVAQVVPSIVNPQFKPFLLHGITGSGKTQIYIELIRRVLEAGHSAIVLIPEIVLTPQIMGRFYHHFGDQVAVIHSRISTGEKIETLHKIRKGDFRIVIGPRSAIFAPFKNLGIIIVDEAHENSYKQGDAAPRYHARDVALYRAQLNKIPIVLGSATPSIESLYNAKAGKYSYFHLSKRISHRNLPRTLIVDNKEQWRKGGEFVLFSDNLLLKLEARLVSKEQAILLQNRRGFSPYILCQECGYVEKCPNCDITLTYHFKGRSLRCHYCGHSEPAPDLCPQCRGLDIIYKGIGTQKIEQEAHARFPHARMLRMDQDTTRRKDDHAKILEKFRSQEADFLIGTKMIAKGLDFEKVTLVGVINADQGLNFPDFRAAERTFQLLVQASGRAGRGVHSGEVVIQTFDPNHFIFKYLMTHDYLGYYEKEMTIRKTLNYPPFSRLCLIRIISKDESAALHYAGEIAKYLWKCNSQKKYSVLGPAPAPLAKIDNHYRYHVLVKQLRNADPSMSYVRHVLKQGIYLNPEVKKWPVTVQIDVDPVDIL